MKSDVVNVGISDNEDFSDINTGVVAVGGHYLGLFEDPTTKIVKIPALECL
jgi:hypothetical protein